VATATSSARSLPGSQEDVAERSTASREAASGAARRPRSAGWSTDWERLEDAIAAAGARANLDAGEHGVTYIEKELSPFEKFVVDATRNALVKSIASELGLPRALLPARVERDLATTLTLLQPGNRPIRAVAYCFCEP
jgi:hypothetical protein